MTVEQLKILLQKYNISPNKTFGQNFLIDDEALDAIIMAAQVEPGDVVLEVGPGIGNWTERLAKVAQTVLAIEKDTHFKKLLENLAGRYPNVHVEFADILQFDFVSKLKQLNRKNAPYKVVANLPYYLTGAAFQLFLRASQKPTSMTVLIQKEVAQNIVAQPGHMNLLALSVQLIGTPHIAAIVPAASCYPPPKVDSALVHIDIPKKPLYPDVDEQQFFRVARACFAGKRKQIHNTLSANLHVPPEDVTKALSKLSIVPTIRPQELTVDQFIALSRELHN